METRLKELRLENSYKKSYVANYLFVKQNTYSQYEKGERELPNYCLIALAKLYETSTDYILGLTDYDFPYPR